MTKFKPELTQVIFKDRVPVSQKIYRASTTKIILLMLLGKQSLFRPYPANRMEHTNTLYGQNIDYFNDEADNKSKYSNHCV
jgi:hypothetical protein